MTTSFRASASPHMTVAMMLAFMGMLTACGGGGGDDPVSTAPAPGMATASVSDTVHSNLTAEANGPATATSSDAVAPGDPSPAEMLASDTATPPSSTANDADAPSDPAPSAV